jgi:hypothetical protein
VKYFLVYAIHYHWLFIGAADTSNNDRCVSFVIGSFESIKNIHKKLGFSNIHMRDLIRVKKELL